MKGRNARQEREEGKGGVGSRRDDDVEGECLQMRARAEKREGGGGGAGGGGLSDLPQPGQPHASVEAACAPRGLEAPFCHTRDEGSASQGARATSCSSLLTTTTATARWHFMTPLAT